MISPDDLLAHAYFLVRGGTEADLRRAVSAAYYALFHRLAQDGSDFFAAAGPAVQGKAARAFNHGVMLKVCERFLRAEERRSWDQRLTLVANAFVDLQEARHRSDYDLAATVKRVDAAALLGRSATALHVWRELRSAPETKAFLAELLLGERLGRRG